MNPAQWILVKLIRVYQLVLSPAKNALFGPAAKCRFTPTCSCYGLDAIRAHGALKGSWLACRRLLRCNPWGPFGHDPVPGKVAGGEESGVESPDSQRETPHCSHLLGAPKLGAGGSTQNHSQLI